MWRVGSLSLSEVISLFFLLRKITFGTSFCIAQPFPKAATHNYCAKLARLENISVSANTYLENVGKPEISKTPPLARCKKEDSKEAERRR
jgi:hypothetical protein